MEKTKVFIAGVGVSTLSLKEGLEEIEKYLENEVGVYQIFTPNPEIVVLAQNDKKFAQILNTGDLALPDGQGLVWASRFLGQPLPERIAGVDFLEQLAKLAAKKGLRVGFIGGKPKIALRALECLKERYPGLAGWAETGPEIKNEEWRLATGEWQSKTGEWAEKIKERKTDILFVGFGAPKQEHFLLAIQAPLSTRQRPIVVMAVGGAFDYLSGRLKRAPKWVQKAGFEWFFRLILEPWRLRRQLSLLKFMTLVFKEKLGSDII